MTREEAIRELKADYCGNRIICELYPDQCNREDCEIWMAIKALAEQPIRVLEKQPDGDAVSRQDAIRIVDSIDTWQAGWRGNAIESLKALPSAQPDLCDGCDRYGASCVGEGCGKLEMPEVAKDTNVLNNDCISRQAAIDAILAVTGNTSVRELYEHVQEHGLSDMWSGGVNAAIDIIIAVPSAQPEITPDGTLNVSIDADIASVGRILLSQTGTQRGGLYYKDAQPEIIHCAECKWLQCNMRQDGTLPKGVDEFECRHWCGYCDPVDFCSHAERRTDVTD